jgi:hypothetical protein
MRLPWYPYPAQIQETYFSETFDKNRNKRSGMAPGSIPHTGALGRLPGNSFLKPVSQAAVCMLENEILKTKDGKRVAETTKGYGMNHNPFEIIGAEGQNRTADTGIFSPLLYRLSYLGVLKLS